MASWFCERKPLLLKRLLSLAGVPNLGHYHAPGLLEVLRLRLNPHYGNEDVQLHRARSQRPLLVVFLGHPHVQSHRRNGLINTKNLVKSPKFRSNLWSRQMTSLHNRSEKQRKSWMLGAPHTKFCFLAATNSVLSELPDSSAKRTRGWPKQNAKRRLD